MQLGIGFCFEFLMGFHPV